MRRGWRGWMGTLTACKTSETDNERKASRRHDGRVYIGLDRKVVYMGSKELRVSASFGFGTAFSVLLRYHAFSQ
jgi:hypothetical protein